MKIRQLGDAGGRRTFVLVCDRGDDPVEALIDAAKRFATTRAGIAGAESSGSRSRSSR